MRKRFIKWLIRTLLPGYHLSKNRSGRRKKIDIRAGDKIKRIAEEMGHESPLGDEISNEYRTSHLGKFPGRSMGD